MSVATKPEHAVLNEHAQKIKAANRPEYFFVDRVVGSKKEFTASCKFQGNVTEGSAFSKNEAKRISAGNMLVLLGVANSSISIRKAPEEPVMLESNNILEDFNKEILNVHLDKYLDTREENLSKFRQLFAGGMPEENAVDESEILSDAQSLKSKTLEKLAKIGTNNVNLDNACEIFKMIVQEMKLSYFAEFLETAKNDRYAVVIKLSINLFTAGGIGDTPEKAIREACKNAIEFLYLFSL